jgi:hypothetical protein
MIGNQRGQAVTETILLTWIMVVFFAAAYQLFLASHTIYQSLTVVHQDIFRQGYEHNRFQYSEQNRYRPRPRERARTHAYVIWRAQDFPEIRMPVVGLFARFGMPASMQIESTLNREPACPRCKTTQMGAGPAGPGTGLAGTGRLFLKVIRDLPRIVADPRFFPALLRDRWFG